MMCSKQKNRVQVWKRESRSRDERSLHDSEWVETGAKCTRLPLILGADLY